MGCLPDSPLRCSSGSGKSNREKGVVVRGLVVSNVMPHLRRTGGEVCTHSFLDAITALGHDLDLVAYSRLGDTSVLPRNFHSATARHVESDLAGFQAYAWLARAYISGNSYGATKYRSGPMLRTVRQLVTRNHYDFSIIDHTQLGWLLEAMVLPQPIILIAHNVESALYADLATETGRSGTIKRAVLAREAKLLLQLEQKLLRECRQVWVLTPSDQNALATIAPQARGHIRQFDVPGPPPPSGIAPFEPDIDVGILGSWLWDANRSGLEWFMREIVPLLPTSYRVHIAGKGAENVPNPYQNVTYDGFVENAIAFLRRSKVVVVPTVAGAGVQIKTIEGISSGVPMVSTAIGLRGISEIPDFVTMGETAADMAKAIREKVSTTAPRSFAAGAHWDMSRRARFKSAIAASLLELGVSGTSVS